MSVSWIILIIEALEVFLGILGLKHLDCALQALNLGYSIALRVTMYLGTRVAEALALHF